MGPPVMQVPGYRCVSKVDLAMQLAQNCKQQTSTCTLFYYLFKIADHQFLKATVSLPGKHDLCQTAQSCRTRTLQALHWNRMQPYFVYNMIGSYSCWNLRDPAFPNKEQGLATALVAILPANLNTSEEYVGTEKNGKHLRIH